MRLTRLRDDIVLIDAKDQYELTSTFIRLQEFYESPYPDIKGRTFSLEEYMDIYAEHTGNFTYFEDWNGFNIPGDVVREFFVKFKYVLRPKEIALQTMLAQYLENDEKFYLIGTHDDCDKLSYIKHELAHAFFYLDDDYRQDIAIIAVSNLKLFKKLFKRVVKVLLDWGYCDEVTIDEFQAYMATSGFLYLGMSFGYWMIFNNMTTVVEFEQRFEQSFNKLNLDIL